MQKNTILQLNQLNREFYESVADEFISSRNYYWSGWTQLVPLLASRSQLRVLDLGCGHGRFGLFLQESLPSCHLEYVGVDFSTELTDQAKLLLTEHHLSFELYQFDLVSFLLNKGSLEKKLGHFDLLVAFGVLHHIPSLNLRQELVQELQSCLEDSGLAVITTWQFVEDETLMSRIQKPESIGLASTDLEANDYILDWRRGSVGSRYCHLIDEAEEKQLIETSQLTCIMDYRADRLNHYLVLQQKETR